jgi:uncharacterized protein YutE (UPF0331/DUF86 family)
MRPFPETQSLREAARQPGLAREALAFRLEQAAWILIEEATSEVFAARLGPARTEKELFDLLQKAGVLDLALARRLKQWTEYRHLASRERVDWENLLAALSEDERVLEDWRARAPRNPESSA